MKDTPTTTLKKLIRTYAGKSPEEYVVAFHQWLDNYLRPTGIDIYGDLAAQQMSSVLYFLLGTGFIQEEFIVSFNNKILEKGIALCRFMVQLHKTDGTVGIRVEFLSSVSTKPPKRPKPTRY